MCIPADIYPVRVKVRNGKSTEEDWKFWKKLYEELYFTQRDIMKITRWSKNTIRRVPSENEC